MTAYQQCKMVIAVTIFTIVLLIVSGMVLPSLISSTLPLFFIITLGMIIIIGLPLCAYFLFRLFGIKKEIKQKILQYKLKRDASNGIILRKSYRAKK